MIKFDRDVHLALKTLEKEGFATYALGPCVFDCIRGETPYDWDLATEAAIEDIEKLFPQGKLVGKNKGIWRVDFTYEVPEKENEPAYLEGAIVDIRHMEGSIEDEVCQYGFTCEAMADNPERGFVDPYNGREDIKSKLVRTTYEPDKMFKDKPIRMMEAVRIASESGFDLQKGIYDGILANWRLLFGYEKKPIRRELERIVSSENAGKGLNMLADSGLMAIIIGEEVSKKMGASEMRSFTTLCNNIDKTKQVPLRRLGLLYTVFSEKRGLLAIEQLDYEEKTKTHLVDGVKEIISCNFLHDEKVFKKYLHKFGLERYEYIHNLAKATRIVYDQPATKVESRNYFLKKVIGGGEPVFVEDLVIDANDVMEAGITDIPEKAEELLNLVIAKVHDDPKNNNRTYLLKLAKTYSKNKFLAKTRYIKWMR